MTGESKHEQVDLTSLQSRRALTKMILRLFDLWKLSPLDQLALLGYSPTSKLILTRFRKGLSSLPASKDKLDRVGLLLSIHKSLSLLYPYNGDLVYRWISTPHRRFKGKSPLLMMTEEPEGLKTVFMYLESQLQ